MKKWYAIGLLVIALALASAFVVACGEEEATTDVSTETTEAMTETTEAASSVDTNTIGLYFDDLGNNIIRITDVPAPGLQFPVTTDPSNDFAVTIEAFDADGNSLGNLETTTGEVDYTAYADTIAKIVVTTFDGTEHEHEIGM